MKQEEAINELLRMKRVVNFHSRIAGSEGVEIFISNDYRDEFIGVMDTAIAATEKQIPKKPIPLVNPGGLDVELCSVCESEIQSNWVGCPYCLNKIDWGNEE